MYKSTRRRRGTLLRRRNCLENSAFILIALLGASLLTVVVVLAVIVTQNKEELEGGFDADQEANVNLYLTEGQKINGGELVDTMQKLSGTSVSFAVKTLSSEGITYYNRDADGNEVPLYTEPAYTTDPKYIRNLGIFEIHISTDEDGRKTVSAVQTE